MKKSDFSPTAESRTARGSKEAEKAGWRRERKKFETLGGGERGAKLVRQRTLVADSRDTQIRKETLDNPGRQSVRV